MTFEEFEKSLLQAQPPAHLSGALQGLWHDAKSDWEAAHECAQADNNAAGAWVHAYLHRKEGDHSNAAYWYRQAGKPVSTGALADEWKQIAIGLL